MIAAKLNRFIYLLILLNLFSYNTFCAQTREYLLSTNNRVAFGNHLFSERDYLRAIDEFRSVLINRWDDSLQFKVGTSFYRMGMFNESIGEFQKIVSDANLTTLAQLEIIRSVYQIGNYGNLRDKIIMIGKPKGLSKLYHYSLLMDSSQLPEKSVYLSHFCDEDKNKISTFYNWKLNPPFKSPLKGALMSTIIPGLGKIYANKIGDGITAFVLTGLFTYLAVDKFQKNQTSSGWLYASIAAFFYSGNIYGSATAVQNYNAGIKFNFDKEVKFYLNKKNQFIPKPKHLLD